DAFAAEYDAALQQGISASGEDKSYFARGRLAWLGRQLRERSYRATSVLDFGCGTGSATPYLLECLPAEAVTGVDVSEQSLRIARRDHGAANVSFHTCEALEPAGTFDLAFCNGVFHHIP